MLFDRRAALPVATMRSSSKIATAASWSRGIRSGMWRFLQPRLVPLAVALTGMFAVLGSAEYLTRLARHTPEQSTPTMQLATIKAETPDPGETVGDQAIDGIGDEDVGGSGTSIVIETGPVGAELTLDRSQFPVGRMVQLPSGSTQVHLVPSR